MRLRSVRSKLFAGMCMVILGFVLVSFLVLSHLLRRLADVEITENLRNGESALRQILDLRRRLLQDKVASLAETPYLKASLQTERVHHETVLVSARQVKEAAGTWLLLVLDQKGRLLADASDGARWGEDLRSLPGLDEVLLIGDAAGAIWPYRGLFLVGIAPIVSGQELVGALVIGDAVDDSFAADIREVTGRDVLLLHRDKMVAAAWDGRPEETITAVELEGLQAQRRASPAADRSGLEVQLGGKRRLALMVPFEGSEVSILLSRSLEDILGAYRSAWLQLLLLGAATTGLALMVSHLASRRLSRRISELMKASDTMAGGDLSVSVPEYGADEIARLAASFNMMVRRIAQLVESVRETAERAEAANRLKTSFLANISHEIRTPMNAILTYADFLQMRLGDDEESRRDLEQIERSGSHLLEIIEDILDSSKIESGQLKIESQPCSPARILDDVLLAMQPLARNKGISLSSASQTGIPGRVLSDPSRIRQALINIVGNAVKFTEQGSVTVTLCAERESDERWRIEFQVQDTGIGIPEDKIDQLFKPFMQVDASTTRKYGGTGLGLSISHRLARLLGGDLTVESKPGAGSRFVFVLRAEAISTPDAAEPVAPGPAAETSSMAPPPAAEACRPAPLEGRILVIESARESPRSISRMLAESGASVEVARDAGTALDRCAGARFDLVVTSLEMPMADGFQVLAGLRRQGVQAPVVAMTDRATKAGRELCLEAGFSAYLPHLASDGELVGAVTALLKKERGRVAALASRHTTPH